MALPVLRHLLQQYIQHEIHKARVRAALANAAGVVRSMRVKFEGYDDLKRRLHSFPEKLRKNYMRGGMRAMVAYMRQGARRRAPSRSGTLRRAIGISTRVFQDGVRGKVFIGPITSGKLKGRDAWYGHIVEGGARPHLIEPKNRKAIAFGGRVFTHVRHPGIKGRYYLRDTATQDVEHGRRLFTAYVESRARAHIEGRGGG